MPRYTSNLLWPYPLLGEDPYDGTFVNFANAIDSTVYGLTTSRPTIDATPAATRLAFWASATALTSDSTMTFATATKRLTVQQLTVSSLATAAAGGAYVKAGDPLTQQATPIPVSDGGTGRASLTANAYLKAGASPTDAVVSQHPIPVTDGGTGATSLASGYIKGAGTGPLTSQPIPIGVGDGGTGATTFTAGYVKSPGTTGALTSVGPPIPVADGGTGVTSFTADAYVRSGATITDPLVVQTVPIPVPHGGTGAGSFTAGAYLKGNGAAAIGAGGTTIPIADGGTGHANGAIAPTIINANGDLIVGTANDTPGILTVGPNGAMITAWDGGTGGMVWVQRGIWMNYAASAALSSNLPSNTLQLFSRTVSLPGGVWPSVGTIIRLTATGRITTGAANVVSYAISLAGSVICYIGLTLINGFSNYVWVLTGTGVVTGRDSTNVNLSAVGATVTMPEPVGAVAPYVSAGATFAHANPVVVQLLVAFNTNDGGLSATTQESLIVEMIQPWNAAT